MKTSVRIRHSLYLLPIVAAVSLAASANVDPFAGRFFNPDLAAPASVGADRLADPRRESVRWLAEFTIDLDGSIPERSSPERHRHGYFGY